MWNIGYNNLNGNYLELGTNWYFVSQKDNIVEAGINGNFAYFKEHFVAVPELHIGYMFNAKGSKTDPYAKEFNAAFYFVRFNASPWHITPELGISVLSLLDLSVGYGVEFSDHDYANFNGLKLGFNLKIPSF